MTEEQWNRIKDYLPPEKNPHGGRPGKSNCLIFHAILSWLNTGIPWRYLPERFGPWQTVYSRFRTWTLAGVWDQVLSALIAEDLVDEITLMLDSTGYQGISACQWWEKRGEEIGRSRGVLTTKVNAVTDGPGNPLRFLLSGGNRNDICMVQELLEPFDLTVKLILADRGYDSAKFIRWVEERGGIVAIPSRVNTKCPEIQIATPTKNGICLKNCF